MKTSTRLWILIAGFLLLGVIPSLAKGYFYNISFTKDATGITNDPMKYGITVIKYYS